MNEKRLRIDDIVDELEERGFDVSKFNAKQRAFVQEYLIDKNTIQAYKRAGYSAKTAHAAAYQAMEKPHIKAAIEIGVRKLSERAELTQDMVVAELRKIGFSDIRKLFDGDDLVPACDLDDDTAGAISSIEVVTRPGSQDGDGKRTVEYLHKIRLGDKRAALVDLGKHLGMFPSRVEHTGRDGGPIEFHSNIERARRLAYVFKRAEAEIVEISESD